MREREVDGWIGGWMDGRLVDMWEREGGGWVDGLGEMLVDMWERGGWVNRLVSSWVRCSWMSDRVMGFGERSKG